MATEHRNIPDPQRHEPKGISTAPVGQIYRSNGSASGNWKDDVIILTGVLADVSTASSILISVPIDCVVVSIKIILGGAITDANSLVSVVRGGDNVSIASITIPYSGSSQGTVINNGALTNTTVSSSTNNFIKISTNGASTGTVPLYISIKAKVIE